MPIDWFTVVAQILNFLVLIWIMKRFLYKPVLRAIAERQERVRRSLTEAAAEKERAAAELVKLQGERSALAEGREAALREAQAEADVERSRLVQSTREEFEVARASWRAALDREQDEFQRELSKQAHREVIGIADKLLRDLADTDLQERILEKFLQMIGALDGGEKETLKAAMTESAAGVAIVRSAFELPPERRAAVEASAHAVLGGEVAVEFETKPSLGCGIELSVDGHKIAWTLEDYLRSLDSWVRGFIAHQQSPHE